MPAVSIAEADICPLALLSVKDKENRAEASRKL